MSEQSLKAFIAKAKNDQSIQDKLKLAKTSKDAVAIAKEYGHEFTVESIAEHASELSDDELEAVAGACQGLQLSYNI